MGNSISYHFLSRKRSGEIFPMDFSVGCGTATFVGMDSAVNLEVPIWLYLIRLAFGLFLIGVTIWAIPKTAHALFNVVWWIWHSVLKRGQ